MGRLDNLGMSYCSLAALIDCYPTEKHLAEESAIKAIALFDHEEVGSASAQGKTSSMFLKTQDQAKEHHGLHDEPGSDATAHFYIQSVVDYAHSIVKVLSSV